MTFFSNHLKNQYVLYCVNARGEIHNILLNWGHSLCKKFSSSIFRTSVLLFMGSVQITEGIQNSPYLAFKKVDIDREGKTNYETIRVEVAKLQSKACFCMVLKLGSCFCCVKNKQTEKPHTKTGEYVMQTICGPQSIKYFLSGP